MTTVLWRPFSIHFCNIHADTAKMCIRDRASMTGESMPVRKTVDGTVFAGTVVEDGEICIRVTGTVGDTRFDRIVKIIEDSEAFKSNLEGRANHLADRLVPWCLGGTLLTYQMCIRDSFQSYAVWPHMTVAENVAYPLKIQGVSKAERDRRVEEALKMCIRDSF